MGLAVACVAVGVSTGGIGAILLNGVYAAGLIGTNLLEVRVKTDGNEFIVKEFIVAPFFDQGSKDAGFLKDAIADTIYSINKTI